MRLYGQYRDIVETSTGQRLADSGWQSNTIANTAWTLLTGLLRNEPGLQGVLYWSVGSGDEAWDESEPPTVTERAMRQQLVNEIDRTPLEIEDVSYRDSDNNPTDMPTSRLEITTAFEWDETQILREFGLFGGDATDAPDSGYLVNYVVHPRVEIEPNARLRRRLQFRFSETPPEPSPPPSQPEPEPIDPAVILEVPEHWLLEEDIRLVQGTRGFLTVLRDASIATIAELVNVEVGDVQDVPPERLLSMRGTARLAIRTAVTVIQLREQIEVNALFELSIMDLFMLNLEEIAQATNTDVEVVLIVRENVAPLLLSLDNEFLAEISLERLVEG